MFDAKISSDPSQEKFNDLSIGQYDQMNDPFKTSLYLYFSSIRFAAPCKQYEDNIV